MTICMEDIAVGLVGSGSGKFDRVGYNGESGSNKDKASTILDPRHGYREFKIGDTDM